MKRFIQGEHRSQSTLLPESLDDYVSDTNPVRVVDVFIDELDLVTLGFLTAEPAETGRPGYHPAVMFEAVFTHSGPNPACHTILRLRPALVSSQTSVRTVSTMSERTQS